MLEVNILEGVSRLLASTFADLITLEPGDLREHEAGLWTLEGDDTVEGSSDAEFVISNQGNDQVLGGEGDDTIMGGRNDDSIKGGIGNDFLRGDRDSDIVEGDEGNDIMFGGKQEDRVSGGDGNDFVSGDLDNDTLSGGNGQDTLVGGGGQDRFIANRGAGTDIITDFEDGIDIIELPTGVGMNDIEISNNPLNQAVISLRDTGELMLLLDAIPANLLTESDFELVGMPQPEVPGSNPPTGSISLTGDEEQEPPPLPGEGMPPEPPEEVAPDAPEMQDVPPLPGEPPTVEGNLTQPPDPPNPPDLPPIPGTIDDEPLPTVGSIEPSGSAPGSISGPAPGIPEPIETDPLTNEPIESAADFEERVLELTNEYRIENGLLPLTLNSLLDDAADSHSQNMAEQDFYSHIDPSGNGPGERITEAGYQWLTYGENIAAGYPTPEDVVQGWIDSLPHRENLLNPAYEEIGIGYYYLENDSGNETWGRYWTQVFGASQADISNDAML